MLQVERAGERETESVYLRADGDGSQRCQTTRSGGYILSIKHFKLYFQLDDIYLIYNVF